MLCCVYQIIDAQARVTHVATRIPFRYGIAEMTQAPHVVIELTLGVDDRSTRGWASEHLPPKWFTKDPDSAFIDDVVDMVRVIEHAVDAANGLEAENPFDLWWQLQEQQVAWGAANKVPGLLSGLGTALVERALIDAACRLAGKPFDEAVLSGALGFDPARIHPELAGTSLQESFADRGANSLAIRQTVGLADPLVDAEVVDAPADGLPVSLEAVIERYGVTHFKIKTKGDLATDLPHVRRILALTTAHNVDPWFTIDGNESMTTAEHFTTWATGLLDDPELGPVLAERLIAVEQPFHRSMALGAEAGAALRALRPRLSVIIDESDEALSTVREAMDLGYAGGTYKGCKGVFRGLANAALVRAREVDYRTVLTAEDLSTLPPLTVAQDLVVSSFMGLSHIERNGHHYFGRLAPIDPDVETTAVHSHPDAYQRCDDGHVRLRVDAGRIAIGSLRAAPFGFAPMVDISQLTPLSIEAATEPLAR
jgi:hypothetical protein